MFFIGFNMRGFRCVRSWTSRRFYLYFLIEKRNNNKLLITLFLLETYENFKKSANFRSRIVFNNFQLSSASSLRRMDLQLGSGLAVSLLFVSLALHSTRAHRFADHHPLLGNLWLATCRYMMAAGVDNRCGCSVSLSLSLSLSLFLSFSLSLPPPLFLFLSPSLCLHCSPRPSSGTRWPNGHYDKC